ncbi:bifunctional Delta(1)-pyrroline-2-carboxylate/Delta(1)-piperideine-2-carboxylate reductase [Hydrogenophaga sp. 2FB]|uniref:bifunctional Delta(1)-pyrroline-2-carboxylate/Delta(1)-piperideine-2- carboxylate reductase n=1 Tax=Hydrogenophaga sp. 2FB TaxID=2502187 RepID=UPI0010F84B57|nr:bifunctional Delta(1)-pyrroline-2-carboxylate/Delta(1)-piperideine-2-carboxylate reductase [Hydrogenophaga sp. 2FB]
MPNLPALRHFDAAQTAALLGFPALVDAIADAALAHEDGRIHCPDRQVLPLGDGGVLLSMPATAEDIGIHKLVTVLPGNAAQGLPTIHGVVTVCDAATGQPLCLLDGPVVTGRRTAAVSLLAIQRLLPQPPTDVLLIGTGTQAVFHVAALHALYPACRMWVQGRDPSRVQRFCAAQAEVHAHIQPCARPEDAQACQVVITLTTAVAPVFDDVPRQGRLVIGVGAFKPEMAEIGARTLAGSAIVADDVNGARHEAGDLIRAGVDWRRAVSLGHVLRHAPDLAQPQVFKSVGSAAWDLAAARVAVSAL